MVVLLLVCLIDLPYGYYQFVRFVAMVLFGLLAYDFYSKKKELYAVLYISLAIMFQPVFKISFGREMWNILDVVVALWLIMQIIYLIKDSKIKLN